MYRIRIKLSTALLIAGLLAASTMSSLASGSVQLPTKPRPSYPTNPANTGTLGGKVLQFAQSRMGQQVGRGECWDLANEALRAAGAHQPGQGGYGTYVYGSAVSLSSLRPGDILQFEGVNFKHVNPNGSWYTSNFAHHTAIVQGVRGTQIDVLHQNVNGDRRVQAGTIDLKDKQSGTILAYRPQPR
jgi:hypothetical protein